MRKSGRSKNWQRSKRSDAMWCFSQMNFWDFHLKLKMKIRKVSWPRVFGGERTLMAPPTYSNTDEPVALMRSASFSARWSAQSTILRSPRSPSCEPRVTVIGSPSQVVTASEQVASKPMPLTCLGETPDRAITSRTVVQMLFQTSVVDCSKI